MHIEISESNTLFQPFELKRKQEGFTTFKSAIIHSMKLFIAENDRLRTVNLNSGSHSDSLKEESND